MTLTSWFSSLRHSRRLIRAGARRDRSRTSGRRASFEALEGRFLLATVSFANDSEFVGEATGRFTIPVTLSSPPTGPVTVSPFASGFKGPDGLAFDSSGTLYVSNGNTNTVSEVNPAGQIIGTLSGFDGPAQLAFDSSGDLYVVDANNSEVSEVNPATGDFIANISGFNQPNGLTIDSAGNLYVSNFGDGTVSKVPPGGKPAKFASGFQSGGDLAIASGNLYVADYDSSSVSELNPAGKVLHSISVPFPGGMAFDSAGNLYVVQSNDTAGTISKVPPGALVASPFASGFQDVDELAYNDGTLYAADNGFGNGTTVSQVTETMSVPFSPGGTAASGVALSGVTASPLTFGIGQTTQDITGTLLRDPGPDQTQMFTLGAPTGGYVLGSPSVNTLTIAEPAAPVVQFGTGGETLNAGAGTFSIPVTISGNLSGTGSVTVPFTLGGTAASGVAFSGVTATPLTFGPGQTTQDITGTLLADPGPDQTLTFTLGAPTAGVFPGSPTVNTLTITEPAGVQFGTGGETVSASAGTFSIPVTVAVTPTVSPFLSGLSHAYGVAVDAAGNLYVTGAGGVSVVSPAGKASPIAASLGPSGGLAVDGTGNLYVIASDNTVKKVTPAGIVSTVAQGFLEPLGLACDAAGDVYVADGFGTVTKVTPAGVVSTFASGLIGPSGLAFDSAGNLYVVDNAGNTVSKVTPAGVVSTFASGFNSPVGLALDAGRLYVADNGDNTLIEVSESVTVPYTLGGTAAAGVAFSGVASGVLTFGIGQTTQDITGRLLSDPGPDRTLTFTLGAPTGDAALGTPSVNTLTITEPAAAGASTPTPTSTGSGVPPGFIGEQRVFSHKGKHKKLVGFEFLFNAALDAGRAQSTGDYRVTQKRGKKVKVLPVESATYDPGDFSVTLSVGGFKAKKTGQVTIAGLAGADGAAIPQILSEL